MLERALSWYDELPAEEAGVFRLLYVRLLRDAGQWAEAREALGALEALVDEDPGKLEALGFLGEVAAALGDTTVARDIEQQFAALDGPYQRGHWTLHRAQILAMLAERERAVSMLRQSFAEGMEYNVWLHREPDLESLRGYPPFEELVRPKG